MHHVGPQGVLTTQRVVVASLLTFAVLLASAVPATAFLGAPVGPSAPAAVVHPVVVPADPLADPSLVPSTSPPPPAPGAEPDRAGPFGVGVVGPVPASLDVTSPVLGHYYMCTSLTTPSPAPTYPRDAGGIVMMVYPWLNGPVYNPVTVAGYALNRWESWLSTRDQRDLGDFLRHAAWLRDKGMDSSGRLVFRWTYDAHSLYAPWYSAMAQGTAISVLLRAYQSTGVGSYLTAARAAARPLSVRTTRGGLAWTDSSGIWLEEYPESPPSHVLNGFIFAMLGLQDLVRVTKDTNAASLLQRTATTLHDNLWRYERNGAILYCLEGESYAYDYEVIHLLQLRNLKLITGDRTFADIAQRWATRFLEAPRPIVTPTSRTVTEVQGFPFSLPGTVARCYRPDELMVFIAQHGDRSRGWKGPILWPNAAHVAPFLAPIVSLSTNTAVTLIAGTRTGPGSATVGVLVIPRVGLAGSVTRDARGPLARLVATVRVGQPDAWFAFDELDNGSWNAVAGVHLAGGAKSGTLLWRAPRGRHVVRVRFLGSVTNGPGVSAPVTVDVY